MKSRTLVALALSVSALLAGCDSSTSTGPNTPVNNASINLTGRLRLDNATSGTLKVTAAGLESALTRNSDGSYSYTLVGTGKVAAARVLSDTVVGSVYLVANDTDTLREIAIRSWTGTVPTNYVVQRNLSITVPTSYVSDTVEAVYWNSDSVAYVLRAPRSSGTKHSTYIYTAYDSAAYYNGKYLFTAFARIRNQYGVVAYTRAFDTTYADAGDLGSFDSTDFVTSNASILKSVPGYTVISNGSHVSAYAYTLTPTNPKKLAETDSVLGLGWHGLTLIDHKTNDTVTRDSVITKTSHIYLADTGIRTQVLYNNGVDTVVRSVPDSLVVDIYFDTLYARYVSTSPLYLIVIGTYSSTNGYVQAGASQVWKYRSVDSTAGATQGHRYHLHAALGIVSDSNAVSDTTVFIGTGATAKAFQAQIDPGASEILSIRYRTEQVVYTR